MARIAYINLGNINNKYNMSQNQNASEQVTSLHKSEQLTHKIQQIKTKISNIPELEHEINSLQNLLKQEQSKTHQTSKKIDNKNVQQRNSAMNSKSYTNVHNSVSPQNSNKKIKIYQLKKKLENRQKQYKDKYVGYMSKLKKQEDIVGVIVDLDEEIKAERGRGKELERYEGVIAADIGKVNQLVAQNAALLAQQREVLNLYQMEKIKKIKEIKRLKKIINQSSQNTEPDQELAESIMQDSEQEQQKRISFKFELTQNNTPQLMSGTIRNQQQILIEDNEDIQQNLISFKRSPLQLSYSPPPTIHNHEQNKQKKKIQSLSQIQPQFYSIQESLDRDTRKYGNILEALSLLRKGNRNLQAKIKHMGITVDMYRHKLQHLVRKNEEENRQMLDNVQKCESVYQKLKERDGERGKIRGKLGIKVENTRMIGILNEQLGLDAQILMQKIPRLQSLSTQSQQIIRRLIGVQQNISQNIRNIL